MTAPTDTTAEPLLTENGEPVPNLVLLRETLDAIAADPASWDQWSWGRLVDASVSVCGTVGCIAFHAIVLDGRHRVSVVRDVFGDPADVLVDGQHRVFDPLLGVHRAAVPATARILLGLTEREAYALFRGSNSLDDLRRIGNAVAARVGETL